MDRRDFIKQTGAAAAAVAAGTISAKAQSSVPVAAGIASPHISSGVRELRVASAWPQTGRGFDDSARRLAQSIATLSDDRYRLTFAQQPRGIDAVRSGDADLFHGSANDLVPLDRTFAYFAGLPGKAGLRPTYLNAWLISGGQTLWDDLSAPHGFKPLLAGHSGARAKLWSREPIAHLADLAGLRIAAPGLSADVARDLGAEVLPLRPAELADALSQGRIDAVEWGGTIAAFGCDLHRGARYCYAPGLSRRGFGSVVAVRSELWNSLTPADQAIFTAAAAQELNNVVAESLSASGRLRTAMTARHGIGFVPMPADVSAAAGLSADRIAAEVASATPEAARIHTSYMAFRAGLPAPRRSGAAPPVA